MAFTHTFKVHGRRVFVHRHACMTAKSFAVNLNAWTSSQEIVAYLLSPQARQLRPLMVRELAVALDLVARDRVRRAVASLPGLLTPRVPLLGIALPTPPLPPILVPGIGLMSLDQAARCALCSTKLVHEHKQFINACLLIPVEEKDKI